MGNMSKQEKFTDHINSHILPFIDYDKLQASYDTDMVYAKGILNRLHKAMVESYGSYRLDDLEGDDSFVMIPGVLRGRDSGKLCLALLDLDLSSSGEHWGTVYLCEHGVVSQGDVEDDPAAKLMNAAYIPYDYGYTAKIPCDIHVEKSRLPKALKEVLKDFHNHNAALLSKEEALQAESASAEETMGDLEFEARMSIMIPDADTKSARAIVAFAKELAVEGSYTKSEYLRATFTEYDLATRQYGQDITRQLLDLSTTFIVNPSKIRGAAMLLHYGVKSKDIPQMVLSGKVGPPIGGNPLPEDSLNDASGKKPSVLEKIREAEQNPKEPKKGKTARNKTEPEL